MYETMDLLYGITFPPPDVYRYKCIMRQGSERGMSGGGPDNAYAFDVST